MVLVVTLLFFFSVAPPASDLTHVSFPINRPNLQATEIPKGRIVESVSCIEDPSQTYAVYLPSNYSPDRKWPVLYALDPGARGKAPLEHYQDAAEKWGWILIGSNNSRNGNAQRSFAAWNAIVKDSQVRFHVDDQRAYATGFSGGARMAMYIAAQCKGCLAGLIVSGAGVPAGDAASPSLLDPTFATAGVDDFNFTEIKRLEQAMNKSGVPHQIAIFNGAHEWPPIEIAGEALEWFELQAMRSGTRARNDQVIETLWQTRMARAAAFEQEKKIAEAYRMYMNMVATFTGLHDIATAQTKVTQLREDRAVKNALRDEENQINRQRDFETRLYMLLAKSQGVTLNDDQAPPATDPRSEAAGDEPNSETQLKSLLSDLRKQATKTEDSGERRVARRVLNGTYILLFERGNDLLQNQKRFAAAARAFELASEVNPDRAGAFYYVAWAHAADGNKKKALRALRTATEKGFSDLATLTNNHAFDSLRNDAEYQAIIQAMQNKKTD
jgi:predicted esterase